jgi:hypothetical protein
MKTDTADTTLEEFEIALTPETVLSALEAAIRWVCDEDTQNAISDRYREIIGDAATTVQP